jgi:hypothetical protein
METLGNSTKKALAQKPEEKALSTRTIALSNEVSSELTAMFLALAMPAELADDPGLTKRLYADAIASLNVQETCEVIRKFRIGDLGDGHWCPKPAMIRQNVLERLERKRTWERQKRLDAETFEARRRAKLRGPKSEGERRRVQAMVDAIKRELPSSKIGGREPTEAEALANLETLAAKMSRPLEISDTLMRQLRGELSIGEGRIGAKPVMAPEAIDKFARETLR